MAFAFYTFNTSFISFLAPPCSACRFCMLFTDFVRYFTLVGSGFTKIEATLVSASGDRRYDRRAAPPSGPVVRPRRHQVR